MEKGNDFLSRMDMKTERKIQPRRKMSKILIFGILGIVLLMVIGTAGFFMLNRGKKDLKKTDSQKQTTPKTEILSEILERDKKREDDLRDFSRAVSSFQMNNRGRLPGDSVEEWKKFINNYIKNGLHDGATGEEYVMSGICKFSESCIKLDEMTWEKNKRQLYIVYNADCNGRDYDDVLVASTRGRQVVMLTILESGKFLCASNR